MEIYTHNCIKCSASYQDKDPEAYYCSSCNEERLRIAKEVDKKMAGRISKRPTVSALQEYDASPKIRGFVQVKL